MRDARDPLLDQLVASADQGAIGLWLIVAIVRGLRAHLTSSDVDARTETLALVREALRRRVLVVGSLAEDFAAWHVAPDVAIERIDREWQELGRDPMPGEIAAFATPARLGFN